MRARAILIALARQQTRILEICSAHPLAPSPSFPHTRPPVCARHGARNRTGEPLTRIVDQVVVIHDTPPIPEDSLKRILRALLRLAAPLEHRFLLLLVNDRVRIRICHKPQADSLEEIRQTQIVPELAFPLLQGERVGTAGAVLGGVVGKLVQSRELLLDEREHPGGDDAVWRVRDSQEKVRKLERGQGESPALLLVLPRLACHKFLPTPFQVSQ